MRVVSSVRRHAFFVILVFGAAVSACGSVTTLKPDASSMGTAGGSGSAGAAAGTGGASGTSGTAGMSGTAGTSGQGGHGGSGAGGRTDGGVDARGACNTDTDCAFRAQAGCCGECLAASDPVPPRLACGILCPAIVPSCTCVNHQCANAPACLVAGAGTAAAGPACPPCPNGYQPNPNPCTVSCQCAPGDAGSDAGSFGCTAQSSSNAQCGGTRPPHYYRCMVPYQQLSGCVSLTIGNATDTYCCP
jgi:hypothetical protein